MSMSAMRSRMKRIVEVVVGAISHRRPPPHTPRQPSGAERQIAQRLESADAVEERSRQRVRENSQEVREIAASLLRRMEARANGDHHPNAG